MDEATRQDSLDHVGFLFAYIADKDIFHKYYSKLLSKRIIQLTSVSDEAEECMLKNLRKVGGGAEKHEHHWTASQCSLAVHW